MLTVLSASSQTDKLFDLSLDELLEIHVNSASKKEDTQLSSPSAIEIITKQELESLKCNRLSECLEFATGISSVNGEGNIFTTTTIRGNTLVNYNTNTLLLVDGIPILNSYHGSFNLDSIPLSSISQIEIVKGAASVLYGTNAINGVINIITLQEKNSGMVRTRYGSNNTWLASTSLSYDINEDLSLKLFAEHTASDAEEFTIKDQSGDTRNFAQEIQNTSLIAKLAYKDFWLHAQAYKRELPNYKTRGFTDNATGLDAKEENDEQEYLLALGYNFNINQDIFLKFQSAYHSWELKKDRLENTSTWDYDSSSFYNELELHMYTNEKSSNILGLSYEYTDAHRYKDKNPGIGENNEATQNLSIYDNGNYLLSDNFNFLYGGRYFTSTFYDTTQSKDIVNDNFSFRTGVIYNLHENIALKALYSQAYRVPTYFEREVSSSRIKGNPNLTPELSQTYDLILVHELDNFNYTLDLFYTQIDDKIIGADVSGQSYKVYQNIGEVAFYGAEISTKFKYDSSFWGFANYTYTQTDSPSDKSVSKFTYENMLNISLTKSFLDNYLVNTNIKYLSNWGDADSYFLWNASVEYLFSYVKDLKIELIAKNILGQNIDLPEIAIDDPSVTTIPKDYTTKVYLGLKYDF